MNKVILILFMLIVYVNNAMAERVPLTGSDLNFLGAFRLPLNAGGTYKQTAYGSGLALRRVNGEVRLFISAMGSTETGPYGLAELAVPELKTLPPWNVAPERKAWGEVFSHQLGGQFLNSLYWDEQDKRLYYTSSGNYIATGSQFAPTLSFLTFNADESVSTSHGSWGYADRSLKQVNFGLTSVPEDFATQYLGGKRLAAGFGGTQSVGAFGPISPGPSLTAFSPPTEGTEGTLVPNTPLVGYGGSFVNWTSGDRPPKNRAWRDDDVIWDLFTNYNDPDLSMSNSSSTGWHLTGDETFFWQGFSTNGESRAYLADHISYPDSAIKTKHWVQGNSFWNSDKLKQSGTWIQTANKEGFLLLATFDTGHAWYWYSTPNAEGINHKWLIYSREQLASVAQGVVGESEIQAARYTADFQFSGVPAWPTPLYHSQITPYECVGMTFDPTDNKLYVMLRYASNAPTFSASSLPLVYVYQINDTIPQPTCYPDADSDTYGDSSSSGTQRESCLTGEVTNHTDCNDSNAAIHPGATEVCGNLVDEDCSGSANACSGSGFHGAAFGGNGRMGMGGAGRMIIN